LGTGFCLLFIPDCCHQSPLRVTLCAPMPLNVGPVRPRFPRYASTYRIYFQKSTIASLKKACSFGTHPGKPPRLLRHHHAAQIVLSLKGPTLTAIVKGDPQLPASCALKLHPQIIGWTHPARARFLATVEEGAILVLRDRPRQKDLAALPSASNEESGYQRGL